jgi:hypothetical protein
VTACRTDNSNAAVGRGGDEAGNAPNVPVVSTPQNETRDMGNARWTFDNPSSQQLALGGSVGQQSLDVPDPEGPYAKLLKSHAEVWDPPPPPPLFLLLPSCQMW